MKEFWKRYGFSMYEVSTEGNVRRMMLLSDEGKVLSYPKMITRYKNKQGVYCVNIEIEGKKTVRTVHKMIATTFIKNPYKSEIIDFKDGDKENVSRRNLTWVKPPKSKRKKPPEKAVAFNYPRGENHWRFKSGKGLSDKDVEEIKASKMSPTELAFKYGITRSYVYQIKKMQSRRFCSLDSLDAKKNNERYKNEYPNNVG